MLIQQEALSKHENLIVTVSLSLVLTNVFVYSHNRMFTSPHPLNHNIRKINLPHNQPRIPIHFSQQKPSLSPNYAIFINSPNQTSQILPNNRTQHLHRRKCTILRPPHELQVKYILIQFHQRAIQLIRRRSRGVWGKRLAVLE